ncbi:starch synthase, partial [Bacillus tropicus]|nr:starch synthase [Bacillus tropicus]
LHTIRRALKYYHNQPVWNQLVKQAMTEDYSWKKSALEYKELYKSLLKHS